MASVNRVTLLGRLGRDPKTSDAQGLAICRLALATTRRYKGRDGEKKEETEWHNVVVFGKTAGVAQQYHLRVPAAGGKASGNGACCVHYDSPVRCGEGERYPAEHRICP